MAGARPLYRAGQFFAALAAALAPLPAADLAEARACLPGAAWPLFDAMPRADQRHSLRVLRALRAAGPVEPALAQAALLHDCAKGRAVGLVQRVGVVLLRAAAPALLARWTSGPLPPRRSWRYGFWLHVNHPARGAELAAAGGCTGLAVTLIRRHQEPPGVASGDDAVDRLLAQLRAVDDDN